MLCEICHNKEATVHLTQVINNTVKKVHLCEECAAKSGVDIHSPISITDLLLGLSSSTEDKACPHCHLRRSDFKKTGRLGCPVCYEAFDVELAPLIKSMHRGTRHVGKMPARSSSSSDLAAELEELEQQLRQAIAAENYERAAQLRDRIKECRARQGGGEGA